MTVRVLAALMLAGCSAEPDETGTAPEPTQEWINAVQWSCIEGEWTYELSAVGAPDLVTVDVFDTDSWDGGASAGVWKEAHPLAISEQAEDASWTHWKVVLTVVPQVDVVVAQSTALVCEQDSPREIATRMRVVVEDQEVDCAIWGQRSEDYFNVGLRNDCHCFDQVHECGTW